jgi:hypothetical protein
MASKLTAHVGHVTASHTLEDITLTEFAVEVTLTIPVCWSAMANATMSTCLQTAMKRTQFGTDGTTVPLLFNVNEAEATTVYALTSDRADLEKRLPSCHKGLRLS